MAGDWIKWQKGLENKPEVWAMSARLGVDRHSVAARCMVVWGWADDNVSEETVDENGHAFIVTHVTQVALQGVTQDAAQCAIIDAVSGVAGFADSLSAVGWMQIRNGSLVFPNFVRHNGETAKQRALAANRQRRKRGENTTGKPAESLSRKVRDQNRTEKRREQPPNPLGGNLGSKDVVVVDLSSPMAVIGFSKPKSQDAAFYAFCCAAHARRPGEADEPQALFRWLLKNRKENKITQADEDDARLMVKEYERLKQ